MAAASFPLGGKDLKFGDSIVRTWVEIGPMISVASCGDSSPAAQAAMTADEALTASAPLAIFGNSNSTVRSRAAPECSARRAAWWKSPSRAFSTALAPRASAWPSNNTSRARVTTFRAPLGRPFDPRSAQAQTAVLAAFRELSADAETVAAAAAASLAGTAGSAAVRCRRCSYRERSGRCWAAGISIPLNGLAGGSEAAGGRGVR